MSEFKHVTDVLPDLMHGRLDAGSAASVEAHLASCATCRRELELLTLARAAARAPRISTDRIVAAIPVQPRARRARVVTIAWRIAAVIVLVAGAALLRVRRTSEPLPIATIEPRADSGVTVPSRPRVAETVRVATKTSPVAPTELATGEALHDLSESELRALLQEIGTLDGVTSSETEVVIPSVGRGNQ